MMATTIQHKPVVLQQQEDEDIALANYLTNGLRFDQPQEAWTYPQQLPQQAYLNNPCYYQQQQQQQQQQRHGNSNNGRSSRARKSSNQVARDIQVQKSASTPISPSSSSSSRTRKSMQPSTKHSSYNNMSSNNSVSSVTSSNSSSHRPRSMMHVSSSERRRNSSATLSNLSPTPSEHNGRRPSVTSVVSSSNVSISSEMSINTKLSLSKRLRKVFSMSNLRASKDLSTLDESSNETNEPVVLAPSISTASTTSNNPKSFRRRSIASLSNLFQKNAVSPPQEKEEQKKTPPVVENEPKKKSNRRHSSGDLREMANNKKLEKKDRPELRVDTQVPKKKGGLKVRSVSPSVAGGTPDSPNSGISPFSRLPPQRLVETLPSPTPSSSSSTKQDEPLPPPVGLHYGVGLHSSPKLKPATSSASSLVTDISTKRRIQFCGTIQVHETFAANDYDRRCDNNATCQKLTPIMAMKIKQELNEYKLTEMEVHIESRQYTHFFL